MHPFSRFLKKTVKSVKTELGLLAFKFLCIAADADGILDGRASALTVQTLTTGNFIAPAVFGSPGAFITATFNNNAHWLASTATITGKDAAGRTISDTFAIPAGGNVTRTSSKRFVSVDTFVIPVAGGTGGTVDLGWANYIVGDIPVPVDVTIDAGFTNIAVDTYVPEALVRGVFVSVTDSNADPSDGVILMAPKWGITAEGTLTVWTIGIDDAAATEVAELLSSANMVYSILVAFEA